MLILRALLLAAGFALVLAPAPACTPAQRATAAPVIADVGSAVPLICSLIPSAGSACSQDTAVASDVAKLIAGILAALPMAAGPLDVTPASFAYRGAIVTLPAWQARAVRAKLGPVQG